MENDNLVGVLDEKYKIISHIGNGGTAKVYLGYRDNIKYAIKIFKRKYSDSLYVRNEIEQLTELSNENVIKIIDNGRGSFNKYNGYSKIVKYIVLEYMKYGDLFDFISMYGTGFGESIGKTIFLQILNGLDYLHHNGIVHRDIKTENIMVDENYCLKLADFGFSTFFNKNSNGLLETLIGTNSYCAPELLREEKYYGIPNDIFSLGVTLFIIVIGKKPFLEAREDNYLYKKIIEGEYSEFWNKVYNNTKINLSTQLKNLINIMLAYDPMQRPNISEIKEHEWVKNRNKSDDFILEMHKRLKCIERRKEIIKKKENENEHFKICLQRYKSQEYDKICYNLYLKKYIEENKKYIIFIITEMNHEKLFDYIVNLFNYVKLNKTYSFKINIDNLKFKVSLKKYNNQYAIEFKKCSGCRFELINQIEEFYKKFI